MIDCKEKEEHLEIFKTIVNGLPKYITNNLMEEMNILWDRAFECGLKFKTFSSKESLHE